MPPRRASARVGEGRHLACHDQRWGGGRHLACHDPVWLEALHRIPAFDDVALCHARDVDRNRPNLPPVGEKIHECLLFCAKGLFPTHPMGNRNRQQMPMHHQVASFPVEPSVQVEPIRFGGEYFTNFRHWPRGANFVNQVC